MALNKIVMVAAIMATTSWQVSASQYVADMTKTQRIKYCMKWGQIAENIMKTRQNDKSVSEAMTEWSSSDWRFNDLIRDAYTHPVQSKSVVNAIVTDFGAEITFSCIDNIYSYNIIYDL